MIAIAAAAIVVNLAIGLWLTVETAGWV